MAQIHFCMNALSTAANSTAIPFKVLDSTTHVYAGFSSTATFEFLSSPPWKIEFPSVKNW